MASELVGRKVDCAGKELLDFGAGHGVLGMALAASCRRVTLVDIAPKMVTEARRLIEAKGLENVEAQGDVSDLHRSPVDGHRCFQRVFMENR